MASVTHPPVHKVREIEARQAKAYIGQFSQRGDLFVAAYQDRRLRVFDTTGYHPPPPPLSLPPPLLRSHTNVLKEILDGALATVHWPRGYTTSRAL